MAYGGSWIAEVEVKESYSVKMPMLINIIHLFCKAKSH